MKYKNIYVAATSQHVGKTTTTLGLVSAFNKAGLNVGYCKPVGQKHVRVDKQEVDKDTVLFADLLKFDIIPELHSPVILGRGATKKILSPDYDSKFYQNKIIDASKKLSEQHDIVVYEGTGHTGVGSVGDVSNARVAKILNASVIMVVEAGIGSTVDMLNMSLALFREEGVEILGVIINKAVPEKIPAVKRYVGEWLRRNNLTLLGVVPYDPTLAYPLVWTVAKAIDGHIELFREKGHQKIEHIIAGSLADYEDFKQSQNSLLVVGPRVVDAAISKIIQYTESTGVEESPLAGIVITGTEEIPELSRKYITTHKIPTLRTHLDTYGAVVKMSKIEVKINRKTPWKITKAIELIRESTNVKVILNYCKIDEIV